ncbi:uncharacterized protein KY384_008985 [Bacidia gigantensis]|uniref:uncharacterized protein n=1 Tax=Bacidia gigantensis TaxID=2732470 RepID=UPI001D03AF3F|nr:uncharacterized protein KY384_008985 [Bacidia gigantensis]KAG8525341.1 hypothetical protein KY384_008985 [Bacidia gigantensis]
MRVTLKGAARLLILVNITLALPSPASNVTETTTVDLQSNSQLTYSIFLGAKPLITLDAYLATLKFLSYLSRHDNAGFEPVETFRYGSVFIQVSSAQGQMKRSFLVWMLTKAVEYFVGRNNLVEMYFQPRLDSVALGLIQYIPQGSQTNTSGEQAGNQTLQNNDPPHEERVLSLAQQNATSDNITPHSNSIEPSMLSNQTNTTSLVMLNSNIGTHLDYLSQIDYGYPNFFWLLSFMYGELFANSPDADLSLKAYNPRGCTMIATIDKSSIAMAQGRLFKYRYGLDGLDRILDQTIKLRQYYELSVLVYVVLYGTAFDLGHIIITRGPVSGKSPVETA